MSLTEAQLESAVNISELVMYMENLHPVVHKHTQSEGEQIRKSREKGQLANFTEGDYVLVVREYLFEDEKLLIRLHGPRRVINALSDYVLRVEDLRTGNYYNVHGIRLKFYRDADLHVKILCLMCCSRRQACR